MKITLRKASALQNSINDTIKGISFDANASINEFQNADDVLNAKYTTLMANVQRRTDLTAALCEIRAAVGSANATCGVNDHLAAMAADEKLVQMYTELVGGAVRLEDAVIAGKLDKIRNRKDESARSLYGREDEVTTSVLSQDDVTLFKGLLSASKKHKQKLQDELLEMNVRTEIELSEKTVAALNKENLL
jgi:hypothetical protein